MGLVSTGLINFGTFLVRVHIPFSNLDSTYLQELSCCLRFHPAFEYQTLTFEQYSWSGKALLLAWISSHPKRLWGIPSLL